MARVMPSGAPDYTSQIAAREAAANDALARLFYTLMARREESMRNEQLRRDLLLQQQSFTAEQNQLNRDWRTDFEYNKPGAQQQPSHLAPGMGGRRMVPAPAAPAAPATRVGPPTSSFTPSGTVGPRTDRFSALTPDAANSYASADFDPDVAKGETVTLSGQSVQTPPSLPTPRRANTPVGTTPQPRQSRRPRMTAQGVWGPIDPAITKTWDDLEKKYNLPRGVLQTHVGVMNNFGRDDGGADGWFRMSPDLRAVYQVNDADVNDIHKMSAVAAQNIARNREAYNRYVDQYNKQNKTNLPHLTNNASDVPAYAVLSQFGVVNGPRVLVSALVNGNAPLAPQMAPEKGVDASRVLVTKGLPATATGNDLFGSDRGVGKRAADVHATTIQHQENPPQPDAGDGQPPPRPRVGVPDAGDVRVNERGAHGYRRGNVQVEPWLVDTVRQASRTLPPGYRVDIISTVDPRRSGTRWHPTGRAIDIQIYDDQGRALPNKGGPRLPGYAVYENMAAAAKAYQMQQYPDRKFTWGGHFDSGVPYDRMHFQSTGQSRRNFTPQQIANGAQAIKVAMSGQRPPVATVDGQPTDAAPTEAAPTTTAAVDEGVRTPMYNQKPITKPKTAAINTFGTKASPPLATMATDEKGKPTVASAIGGAQMAPKMQIAEETPVEIPNAPTRTVVPNSKAIPAETSAAANQPTPQTAQSVEQPTQATPAPTPSQVATDSGYTADDMDERSATRLSSDEQVPLPPTKPAMSIGGPSRSLRDLPAGMTATSQIPTRINVGTMLSTPVEGTAPGLAADDFRTGAAPEYQTATDNPFEAELGPQPGEYTGAITGAVKGTVNNVIQGIQQRASEYNKMQADRNAELAESQQLGQVYNYPQVPSISMPSVSMPEFTRGYLDPNKMYTEQEAALDRRIANPAPQTGIELPNMPQIDTGYLRPDRMYEEQNAALERRVANPPPHTGIDIALPSRDVEPTVDLGAGRQAAYEASQHRAPSYAIPPQVQELMEQQQAQQEPPPISSVSPLPVETGKLASAIFNALPTVTVPDMSNLLAGLLPFKGITIGGAKPSEAAKANTTNKPLETTKVRVREVLPSGEELYPTQPEQRVPPKNKGAKPLEMPTVPGVTTKSAPTAIPSRTKYAPDKKYSRDPTTGKSVIDKEEPVEQIAPDDEDEQ